MTPKEKAEELFKKYRTLASDVNIEQRERTAKKCALIAIDEILKCNPQSDSEYSTISFWQEVKQEIEKL